MEVYVFFTHRRLRLLSGLVMLAYITIHLLNHALGIISLAVAENGLRFEMAFWRTPIMTLLLYGAVATRMCRVSTQIADKPASASALNSHCESGPASNPIRLK
jgi:hypothetical protein